MNERSGSPEASSLRDICRVLFRQKWRALWTAAVVLLLTAAGLMFGPRKYASEAKIFLRVGRESMSLDPTATTGQNMSVTTSREHEIQSALDMLRSRVLLERVAEVIGPGAVLSERLPRKGQTVEAPRPGLLGRLRATVSSWFGSDDVSDHERAVRQLVRWVDVSAEKRSSVVSVACYCGSPELAQRVVQELVDQYRHEHVQIHRTSGSREFFEQQTRRVTAELDAASQRLRDAKNAVGVVSVDVQRDIIQKEISDLNLEMARAKAALSAAQSKIGALKRAHPELQSVDAAQASGLTSKAIDDMRQQLYSLQLRDQELASMFLEQYPKRVAIRKQVEQAQQILAQQELLVEQSGAASSQAQLAALQQDFRQAERKLQTLNRHEVDIQELGREVERLKNSRNQYAENLEVARIDDALAQQKISNVNLLQPASFQGKAVSPNKTLVAVLGLLTAVFGAFAAAVVSEMLDPTLKTPEEVESQVSLPVLVSIPRMSASPVELN